MKAICDKKEVPVTLVSKLLDTEQQMDGMSRRAKIQDRIDEIFHEDWRSEEEVYSNIGDSGSGNDSPQLILNNVGLFRGTQTIHLTPKDSNL